MVWLVIGVTLGLSAAMAIGCGGSGSCATAAGPRRLLDLLPRHRRVGLRPDPFNGTVPERQILVAVLFGLWPVRLGGHLAWRVATSPEDARYAQFRITWAGRYHARTFGFLQVQALAMAVLASAVLAAAPARKGRSLRGA